MIGTTLSTLVALSFLGLGAGAFAAPAALSRNYGLPVTDESGFGYVRALGARDAVLGLLVAWFLATDAKPALGATLACSALVACSDFGIVARVRGTTAPGSLAIHGGGVAGLLLVLAALRAKR